MMVFAYSLRCSNLQQEDESKVTLAYGNMFTIFTIFTMFTMFYDFQRKGEMYCSQNAGKRESN